VGAVGADRGPLERNSGLTARLVAIALLDDVFCDFPFKDAASRSHVFAALLLPFVRELIDGPTPLHLFDAPTPGTGKGLLMNVLSLIHTGRGAAMISAPSDDDEWRKRITAMLFRGQKQIVLDNLPQTKSVPTALSCDLECLPNRIDEDERRSSPPRGTVRGTPRGHPQGAPDVQRRRTTVWDLTTSALMCTAGTACS
jgi:hypothetical protein